MIVSIQRFCRNCILDSDIHSRQFLSCHLILSFTFIEHVTVERDIFIQSPCTGTVVNHNVPYRITPERVITMIYIGLSTTETHMTHYNIMSLHPKRFTGYTNTVTRCCLSGNSNIRSANNDRSFQFNNPCHIEYNDTGTTCFASLTKRSGTCIIQIGYSDNLTTTSSKRIHTSSFSTWESGNFCLRQIVRTACPRHVRTTVLSFFHHNGISHSPCRVRVCI